MEKYRSKSWQQAQQTRFNVLVTGVLSLVAMVLFAAWIYYG